MYGKSRPATSVKRPPKARHTTECPKCGHLMRVKMKHIGRVCRCTRCQFPIFVTHDQVTPPVKLFDRNGPRYFEAEDVPINWSKGDRFDGRYEVRELLGHGGMGIVYRVHHKIWGLDLAVKTPHSKLVHRDDILDLIEKEAEVWVGLPMHPNIVYCYYVRRLGGIPRVFMEYVPGRDLADWINDGTLYGGGRDEALRTMLHVGGQMACALQFAHGRGLVHQDVKPVNILLTPSGHAKITDFGLVRAQKSTDRNAGNGNQERVMGTPSYSAPEQYHGSTVSAKADLWGWAASMVEMIAGGLRWENWQALTVELDALFSMHKRLEELPEPPEALTQLLRECFRVDPQGRPEGMEEVINRLEEIHESLFDGEYLPQEARKPAESAATLNNSAVSLNDLGKSGEAASLWTKALRIDHEHVESQYNLGLSRWRNGEQTDAEFVQKLMSLCNNDPKSWLLKYGLGCVLTERGDQRTAVEVLETIPEPDFSRREVLMATALAQGDAKNAHHLLHEFQGHDAPINCVDLSLDGSLAVTTDVSGLIKVWEIGEACVCRHKIATSPVHAVRLTHNKLKFLTGDDSGGVSIWDANTGECAGAVVGHDAPVRCLAPHRDGVHFVTGSEDMTVRVWGILTGKCLGIMKGHASVINAVDYSRCGRFVLSGSTDTYVKLWRVDSQGCVKTLVGHRNRVYSVLLRKDGKTAVSGSRDGTIRFWDLEKGTCIETLEGHKSEVYSLSLSESTNSLLSGSRHGAIRLWDLAKGYCIRSFGGCAPCVLSRMGNMVISGDDNGLMRIWNISPERCRHPAPYLVSREWY